MPLSITLSIRSVGVVVLLVRGRMLLADIETFRSAFAELLRAHRPGEVQLDLSGLLEIDVGAAAAVTAAVLEAARAGTRVTIVHASTSVGDRMRVVGGKDLLR